MDAPAEPSTDPTKPRSKRRRVARLLLSMTVVAAVIVGTVGVGAAWLLHRAFEAPGPSTAEKAVVVPRGASVRAIAALLAAEGVVGDATVFSLGVRAFGGERPLVAGEFAFPAAVSARTAMEILQSGVVVARNLTIPEGLTVPQVLALLRDAEALEGEVPAPPQVAEGSLLPETYQYVRGERRADLLARMQKSMDEALAALWPGRSAGADPLTSPREAVILASIVERETGKPEERPRVAAVFLNRLRRGMRLQSDPTVAFGLSDGSGVLGRPLTRADLGADHPYNTYVIDGLPLGPIANPGRASLAAVLQPAQTKELYFVADGNGGHAFATTLEEHNRNVAKWRRIQRQQRDK